MGGAASRVRDGAVVPGEVLGHDDGAYTLGEVRSVALPCLVAVAVVLVAVVGIGFIQGPGSGQVDPTDVRDGGTLTLSGYHLEEPRAYGPHARAFNLTLLEGDGVSLEYTSAGPDGGVQVRLQHPLRPEDGVGGLGRADVLAGTSGTVGTIRLLVERSGAYQIYFWHPGSARPPGDADHPGLHVSASISYSLRVERAHRPLSEAPGSLTMALNTM